MRFRVSVAWSESDGYRDALEPLLVPAGHLVFADGGAVPVPEQYTVLRGRLGRSLVVRLSVWQSALRRVSPADFERLIGGITHPEGGAFGIRDLWRFRKALAAELPVAAVAVRTIVAPGEQRV
jgi:hypothetical protein